MAKAGSPLGWLLLDGYNLTGAKPKTITLSIFAAPSHKCPVSRTY